MSLKKIDAIKFGREDRLMLRNTDAYESETGVEQNTIP